MNATETIVVALIGCVSGGGLATLFSTIFKHKEKNKEADTDIAKFYIEKLQELTDRTDAQYQQLQEKFDKVQADNESMKHQIVDMNRKLTELNRWVIFDNAKYRTWLEDELRKRDPDILIPDCPPPPNVFYEESEESQGE